MANPIFLSAKVLQQIVMLINRWFGILHRKKSDLPWIHSGQISLSIDFIFLSCISILPQNKNKTPIIPNIIVHES